MKWNQVIKTFFKMSVLAVDRDLIRDIIKSDGPSRRHDGSLDHRWVRWWEMRPILDAQTRLQMSQVNSQSGNSWRPVLRWTRLSWSDSIRRRSKSDTCFLNEDRQDDLSAVRFSSLSGGKSQAVMFIFSIYLCTSSADRHGSGYRVQARNKKWFSGDGCLPSVWRDQPNAIELSSAWPRFPSSCRSVALQYLVP